ncbi:MAG: hypothetical protein WDZ45_05880 [Flavobacteriaceae bacterium]
MKRAIYLLVCFVLVASCSSLKRSQKELNKGNYHAAIDIALKKLQKNKTKKGNQELIPVLEDAFQKGTASTLRRIEFLKKEGDASNNKEILNLYSGLERIQDRLRPLLPLYNIQEGREARFDFNDYSEHLIEAKEEYVAFLYEESRSLMDKNTKLDFRKAHKSLTELQKISPYYKDTDQLLRDARYYGTDYVFVELNNKTNQIIPARMERDLLDFNTYGLDDYWTEFHSLNRRDIDYDFEVMMEFRELLISPERIQERQIPLEREVKDGFTYQVDRSGNYILDSLGNRIKVDRFIIVKGTLFETIQTKALALSGKVDYYDVQRRQLMNSHPLETEFVFENVFATFKGDERVLSDDDKRLLRNRFLPFPSNEQMLIDASEEIKGRLSAILKRNKFR